MQCSLCYRPEKNKGRMRKLKGLSACMAVLWLLALNAPLALAGLGQASPEEVDSSKVRVVLNAGEYSITKDKNGFDMIHMEGFSEASSPGNPILPHKVYDVLVHPEAIGPSLKLDIVSADIQILAGTYDIKPGWPASIAEDTGENKTKIYWGEGKNIVDGKNLNVYEKDANYPENYVELLPYSEMRKWKFARVDFTPLQYNPISKKLTLIKSAVVEISYETSPSLMDRSLVADTVMDGVAEKLFLNYNETKIWYEKNVSEFKALATYDYVIITTNAIVSNSAQLYAFIAHKQSLGYNVKVVTESNFDILTGQAPNHRAEKIRQWLKNNYASLGIKYVLLIGDPHPYESGEGDIPMKMCWPRYDEAHPNAPTDYFYADLTGNWDIDGDLYYGEWSDYITPGGVNFAPEVYVGRIPVYDANYVMLDNILLKIIDYETADSTGWRKSILMPMSFSDSSTDGARLSEQMRNDYLNSYEYSSYRMYQQGNGACGTNSPYTSEQELRGGTGVRDQWATNCYGVMCWWGHGSATYTGVGYTGCEDGTLFQSSYCPSLDDNHPSFTYQCSCTNAYPENSDNLAYAILKQGGISTVSASRVSIYWVGQTYGTFDGSDSNAGIGYEYVKRLVTEESPGGNALYNAKQSIYPSSVMLTNWYDFNLYGDPSVSLKNPVAVSVWWYSLGGYVTSLPNMIVDDQGRVHIFVVGGDNALWDNIDGVWYRLGGGLASAPFPVKDVYGRIHVLVRGSGSALWDLRFDTAAWTASWYFLGGCIAEMPTATRYWEGDNIAIMARACDDSLWLFDLTDPVGMSGTWLSLSGSIRGVPYVMEDISGNVHTFVRGPYNALWDNVCDGPLSFTWYYLSGGLSTGMLMPSAVNEPERPGYIAIMVRAADNSLWVCDLLPDKSAHWVPLSGGIISGGYAITDTADNIHTFVKGADSAAWENVFYSWNPSGAKWQYQGGGLNYMAWHPVAFFANGYTHMVVVGPDNALYMKVYPTISPSAALPSEEEERTRIEVEPNGPRGINLTGYVSDAAASAVETPVELIPVGNEVATMKMSEQSAVLSVVEGGDVNSITNNINVDG